MSQYATIIMDLRELKVEADCRSLTWRPIEKEIAISSVDDKETVIGCQRGQLAPLCAKA